MTLIKSISGIRGTIGNNIGDDLTPLDIVRYTAAYATYIKSHNIVSDIIIIGRDARISGEMVSKIVSGTLISCGLNVIDIGLSTTPTVEMAVIFKKAAGGIIITASHNPKEWNALKLLNQKGEFISEKQGKHILDIADNKSFVFNQTNDLGRYTFDDSYNDKHIDKILSLSLVDVDLVSSSKFKVVVDAVNSTGGFMVPRLLDKMGVEYIKLYCEPNGCFPHNPEPLPEYLQEISKLVVKENADFGIVVDPDVDRLAIVCEDGSMFGEEYTLVSIVDYILNKNPGNTVSNLSSTRAVSDITNKYNCSYKASAVGEVNVVETMKETNAVIGGEGNGGVILPELHYGRDALVAIALFLTQLAESKMSVKKLRDTFPKYFMSKNKILLTDHIDIDKMFSVLINEYNKERINIIDGLKIDFDNGWIHLRKSNTEPIIRIYTESSSQKKADSLAKEIIDKINSLI